MVEKVCGRYIPEAQMLCMQANPINSPTMNFISILQSVPKEVCALRTVTEI